VIGPRCEDGEVMRDRAGLPERLRRPRPAREPVPSTDTVSSRCAIRDNRAGGRGSPAPMVSLGFSSCHPTHRRLTWRALHPSREDQQGQRVARTGRPRSHGEVAMVINHQPTSRRSAIVSIRRTRALNKNVTYSPPTGAAAASMRRSGHRPPARPGGNSDRRRLRRVPSFRMNKDRSDGR